MKYETMIFCKILSGLYQQKVFSKEKRDRMVHSWQDSTALGDTEKMICLVQEVSAANTNPVWRQELNEILERI